MRRRSLFLSAIALCTVGLITWAVAQTTGSANSSAKPAAQGNIVTFKATTEIVLVNLTVRDKNGNLVKDLKPSEISIYEAGAPAAKKAAAPAALAAAAPNSAAATAAQYRDHRLIVLYFDLTTMQPEDVQNVMEQAEKFVQTKMQPADLAAITTLGDSLQVNQDFTADKTSLMRVLRSLNPATSSGFGAGGDGTTDGTADNGNS